ncbi:hypothetical protein VHUM_02511 [Vanrija humicola]|uniref:Uncharacterized protein n=1 Tax=Vanrija humicola TaxID=5417 RepID=A0A7D8V0Q9_VANHU|nr:hypothetical protein VHUM_02511 [Vanrija humicola]
MRFSTRNAFYLRASNYRVVPLFLYLDERHVDWMSEKVLNLVIEDLKDKMEELLTVERYEKKHRVHVERGDTYQYCYFLRKTTRTEVVLLKKKTFSLRPPSPPPPPPEPEPSSRKRKAPPRSSRARTRSESVLVEAGDDEDEEIQVKTEDGEFVPEAASSPPETSIKDWKPDVKLAYQGFGTSSVQLVLIVEPYPPLPPSQYAPPLSRLSTRSASIAASRSRSRTQAGGQGTRYSSTSLALDRPKRTTPQVHAPNMRNASRSVSATPVPNSRRGGSRDFSVTPGPGASGASRAPLFIPRDTPFDEDEEDEDEHEAYAAALREGRLRLPSVMEREDYDDDEENPDDMPETMLAIGERLVRASEIEENVIRSVGGWEERGEGEESAVLGREEPGE